MIVLVARSGCESPLASGLCVVARLAHAPRELLVAERLDEIARLTRRRPRSQPSALADLGPAHGAAGVAVRPDHVALLPGRVRVVERGHAFAVE